jgi:hypothetical protein
MIRLRIMAAVARVIDLECNLPVAKTIRNSGRPQMAGRVTRPADFASD